MDWLETCKSVFMNLSPPLPPQVCVHSCLSAELALRDVGTALMYNIATKEVKTVVSIASDLSV